MSAGSAAPSSYGSLNFDSFVFLLDFRHPIVCPFAEVLSAVFGAGEGTETEPTEAKI